MWLTASRACWPVADEGFVSARVFWKLSSENRIDSAVRFIWTSFILKGQYPGIVAVFSPGWFPRISINADSDVRSPDTFSLAEWSCLAENLHHNPWGQQGKLAGQSIPTPKFGSHQPWLFASQPKLPHIVTASPLRRWFRSRALLGAADSAHVFHVVGSYLWSTAQRCVG